MLDRINDELAQSITVKKRAMELSDRVAAAAGLIIGTYRKGRKVFFCGNGGSAADAQHLAAEMLGRFRQERAPLPALALHTNTSVITAVGNDYSYDKIFVRQMEGLAVRGDILVAISTSGNSSNVIQALEWSRSNGIGTIGLTGESGGKMASFCDVLLAAPSDDTARIQELHITWGHIICGLVEETIFGEE